jgi:phosphate/sulfate permease
MVKFGKRLEHGGLKIPRWKNKYVNYNMLKKYIKQIKSYEATGDLVNAETRVANFIKILDEDMQVIEATYVSVIDELQQSVNKVNNVVEILVSTAAFNGELEGEVEAGSETEENIQTFTLFSRTLDEINKFCLVNFEGVRKILKKFKKQVTVRDITDEFQKRLFKFSFCHYTNLENNNSKLKRRERILYDRISQRSPLLEQYIKDKKGLEDILDKHENEILNEEDDHDLQCCEFLIKFTCCKIENTDKKKDEYDNMEKNDDSNDDDDDKNKHHGDLCKYYTNKCCQKTCLGTIVKSHFKRWLIVASGTLLLFIGTIIVLYEIVQPSRLNSLTIIGYFLAVILGIANGANDICNSVGTSVGAKALTLRQAIIFGAFFEFMGALFMGTEVAKTISKGVIEPSSYSTNPLQGDCDGPKIFAVGMSAVLMGAGLTTLTATVYGLPISATHGIIGSLVAVGLISRGPGSIGVQSLVSTVVAWVVSPLVGAIVAGVFHFIIQFSIYSSGPTVNIEFAPLRSKRLQPVFLAVGITISCAFLLTKGPPMLKIKPLGIAILVAIAIGIGTGIILLLYRLAKKGKNIDNNTTAVQARDVEINLPNISDSNTSSNGNDNNNNNNNSNSNDNENDDETKGEDSSNENNNLVTNNLISLQISDEEKQVLINAKHREQAEKHFVPLLILSALTVAFAHGGNDVGNAIGPLAVILEVRDNDKVDGTPSMPLSILFLGALSFVFGIILLGPRTIKTVGSKITSLTPSKSYATQLGAAVAVLLSTSLSLPVSTSHCLVGAVVGVGISGKAIERCNKDLANVSGKADVDFGMLKKIVWGWAVTIPSAMTVALIGYAIFIDDFTDGIIPQDQIVHITTKSFSNITKTYSNITYSTCPKVL